MSNTEQPKIDYIKQALLDVLEKTEPLLQGGDALVMWDELKAAYNKAQVTLKWLSNTPPASQPVAIKSVEEVAENMFPVIDEGMFDDTFLSYDEYEENQLQLRKAFIAGINYHNQFLSAPVQGNLYEDIKYTLSCYDTYGTSDEKLIQDIRNLVDGYASTLINKSGEQEGDGWVRVETESDLPEEDGDYWIANENGVFDFFGDKKKILAKFKNKTLTHYYSKKVTPPSPPKSHIQ